MSISTAEAAKRLGVSSVRVRQLCQQGRIRPEPKKVGRDWVIADKFEVVEAGWPGMKIQFKEKKE